MRINELAFIRKRIQRTMRILILNWRDIKHPLAGGAEISTHEHAKRWTKAGYKVIQFSSAIKDGKSEEVIDGIQIIRRGNHYTVHLYAFFYYLKHLRSKVDLVIDEFHFIPFFTPLYVKEKKLAFIHETAEEVWFKNQPFPINIVGFLLEPLFFKFYKGISFMTVSQSTKKDLVRFGINDRKIKVINNGVKVINSSSHKEKMPTMVYLGRLAKDKGTEDAISAFYEIQKHEKNSRLWIVGREESRGYLKKLQDKVKDLNISKKIMFYGYVSEEKKFDLLKRAWVLIHPSIKEGWGLTVIEAASQGTPTVAYDISGLRDSIIDGKTGLLTDNKTAAGLTKKIMILFNNPSQYKTLSKNASLWSKKFNWEDSTKESLNLINNLIK